MRRNIILPIKNVVYPSGNKQVNLDDILEVGKGTLNFAGQFKPVYNRVSAKSLLLDDKNYGSPNENYFGYIAKRKL